MQQPDCIDGGWIGGPRFDACFFFGSAALALAAGVLMLVWPALVLPLWFAWIWLIEGPHLFATWQRTYLDAGFRRERGALLMKSLLWFVPGPLLLAATWISGSPAPFQLYLGALALWSFHHTVRQHHGILSIYQRLGGAGPVARKIDGRLLHSILWGAFVLFLVVHPENRALLGLPPFPGEGGQLLIAGGATLIVLALLAWTLALLLRWRRGSALKPGLFGLAAACGITLFSFFVIGLREPLLLNAATTEQVFMAATLVSGSVHGMQYIGIVIATERRRAGSGGRAQALSARLGRAPLLAYAVMVAASLAYVGLSLARGGPPGGAAPDSTFAQVFMALYWGLFSHHFWLDQKIWRPSSDARLRTELGLGGA